MHAVSIQERVMMAHVRYIIFEKKWPTVYNSFFSPTLITGLRHNLSKSFSMVPRAILTHLWLDDCFDDGKLVPILYYHQPITIDLSLKPCEGAVIGISNYSGRERTYIRLVF